MPRRNPLRFPSYRNLCVYHELAFKRRSQAAVAAEIGISQRAVSGIGMQVRTWVDSIVKPHHYLGQPGMRFHLAIAQERIRLKDAFDPLIGMFTGDDGQPRYLRRYVTVINGEALNTLEVSENPNFRLLNQALQVQTRLAELEAVANAGPFFDLPNQLHQTVTHRAVNRRAHAASASDQTESPSNTPSNSSTDGSNCRSNHHQNQAPGVLT